MRAVIFGCQGTALTPEEAAFFKDTDPFGFILFARNCETPAQIRALVQALRDSVGRANAPVLIDQEGGRVARLKPPQWPGLPPAEAIGQAYLANPAEGLELARLHGEILGTMLADLGIDVDCAPVLDVRDPAGHDVIGDRAFSSDPAVVAALGRAQAEGLLAAGVLPVIKHIPGHGRARADSHLELPVIAADLETLEATDFAPFMALSAMPLAMTAHLSLPALDENAPVTLSERIISGIIRGRIGFDGCLMTDDLSMKALNGPLDTLAARALGAGCDLILHCNGQMAEMEAVAKGTGVLEGRALDRVKALDGWRQSPDTPLEVAPAVAALTHRLRQACPGVQA